MSDPTVAPAPATMTKVGRRFLGRLAAQATSGVFLEIGPLFGSSTQEIAASRRREAPLHTIDTFAPAPWIERRLGRNLSRRAFDEYTSHIPGLVVHEGFAPDVVRDSWSEPIGFYFDDATHGDPGWSNNFDFFSRFFTEDAIVCGDDFAGGWPDIPRNVTRIAEDWGCELFVIGRVWAITRSRPERIATAVEETVPGLAGARLATQHDQDYGSRPAAAWSQGLHRRRPLTSFCFSGDPVADLRFTTYDSDGSPIGEYGAGEWVALDRAHGLVVSGSDCVGYQLCLAGLQRTENTKTFRAGSRFDLPEGSDIVAIRLEVVER